MQDDSGDAARFVDKVLTLQGSVRLGVVHKSRCITMSPLSGTYAIVSSNLVAYGKTHISFGVKTLSCVTPASNSSSVQLGEDTQGPLDTSIASCIALWLAKGIKTAPATITIAR